MLEVIRGVRFLPPPRWCGNRRLPCPRWSLPAANALHLGANQAQGPRDERFVRISSL
jgi:hypothetical protein